MSLAAIMRFQHLTDAIKAAHWKDLPVSETVFQHLTGTIKGRSGLAKNLIQSLFQHLTGTIKGRLRAIETATAQELSTPRRYD